MNNWNLKDLYSGFDQKYENDLKGLENLTQDYKKLINQHPQKEVKEIIEGHIKTLSKIVPLVMTLSSFASLTSATDVTNAQALSYMAKISQIMSNITAENVLFSRLIADVELKTLAKDSKLIQEHLTTLEDIQKNAKYLLSEKEEVLYNKLSQVSSRGWSQLQNLTTATLNVKFNDQEITFSDLRNLAYDVSADVRKKAYELELSSYRAIDDFTALALSNIKREVQLMADLRGYQSVLQKTLIQSDMKQESLDAMISAMMDYAPAFREYLKQKAKFLGHQGSLPFYDLFAPVGKLNKTYTYKEAQDLTLKAFAGYSQGLVDYTKKAFDNHWIDVEPKKGKRGGAFCANLPQLKQSRILLNFEGSLSDIMTLAHELGHGYHGEIISSNLALHWQYSMPLAETASIFCEAIVTDNLLKEFTNPEERLSILENGLQGDTQVIIDILSRFFFEQSVFEKASGPIAKEQMNQMMIDAQIKAYGDGLDHNYLHPYMWLVKGHYYSAGLNFYNFPYAFGLLFAKGLYAQYLKDKTTFIKKYDQLLSLTTKATAEEVAASMNIDITKKEFWLDSLAMIKKDIDEVIHLFKTIKGE